MPDISIDQIKRQRATDIRIMRDRAAVGIAKWALPTIILLFAGLVGSIVFIEDMSAIAIISAATSSTSMALISILNQMTGAKEKEDPIIQIIKMYSDQNAALIDHLKADRNKSTELVLDDKAIKVVDGNIKAAVSSDILYGRGKKPNK